MAGNNVIDQTLDTFGDTINLLVVVHNLRDLRCYHRLHVESVAQRHVEDIDSDITVDVYPPACFDNSITVIENSKSSSKYLMHKGP